MSEDSPLYRCDRSRVEDNPGYLIKMVYNSMNRALDQEMAPLGLTATQWRPVAMIALGRADTAAELARLNGVDTGAMTRTLDRLEAKKLVRRQRSEQDRRVVRIELTEEGQAIARDIPANIARTVNHYLRGFSEAEVAMLMHFMRRMLANGSAPVPPGRS
ncbi:MarR family winged helix-turn-helix transcriptional regulator [Bordetella genomosp. 9]|uniref:MarR family transcriptional regulator n=1 Tax=Bordetella genomosp. 9 TaxID=1416803 RepID=A0A1W6YYJ5_9BORD|nr:MarR family transcriptional regulator [Bordetella genomosp. 9]ARP86148.1 MarR family transcriptional regulator [Bordetella genomosp. 9]ARP90169.1 MarR family transcriptional regulator [Bordetella genomosp. 9]